MIAKIVKKIKNISMFKKISCFLNNKYLISYKKQQPFNLKIIKTYVKGKKNVVIL